MFPSLPVTSFQIPLSENCQESCHISLLGPSMDLGLDLRLSASLYISFLRISASLKMEHEKMLVEESGK